MLNHGLNHGLFLSLIKFFRWKYILNWINSEYKILDCYIISDLRFLLEIKAILPETSLFLSAQMAVLSSFFQIFIVLGVYNFAESKATGNFFLLHLHFQSRFSWQSLVNCKLKRYRKQKAIYTFSCINTNTTKVIISLLEIFRSIDCYVPEENHKPCEIL
jgi:fucose 4-O-acetylase-like acetyltransferase